MNFKPLGDRVLVKRIEEENKTASGIIIPDNSVNKSNRAEVVATSDFVKSIEEGNTVIFSDFSRPSELKLDGNDYLVLEVKDILGVIK